MKYVLLFICSASLLLFSSLCAENSYEDSIPYGGYYTNKSYYSDKIGWFQSGTYMHTSLFRTGQVDLRPDGWRGAIQAVPFFGRITDHSSHQLAAWFGYNHKGTADCPIVFGEQTIADAGQVLAAECDLDARHFNIWTNNETFKSKVWFFPEHAYTGIGFSWKQALWCNDDGTHRWWFELVAPFVQVRNRMRMSEQVITSGGGAKDAIGIDEDAYVGTIAEAFMQPGWWYGKIAPCGPLCGTAEDDMKRSRFTDVELKIGCNSMLLDCAQLESFVGVILPTGNKSEARYLFEAIAGNGGHVGITFGTELGFKLSHTPYGQLGWFISMEGRYLFSNHQMRSFDLVGRPWSRYQTMFATKAAAKNALDAPGAGTTVTDAFVTHGINLMTRCVEIHPRGQYNLVSGWEWSGTNVIAEVGYAFYARQAERITPNWTEGPILASRLFVPTGGVDNQLFLAPVRTMADPMNRASEFFDAAVFETYYDALKIRERDVDWSSASHPGVVSNTLYGTVGYQDQEACYPYLFAVGAAWDYAFTNTAMHKITFFLKGGVAF